MHPCPEDAEEVEDPLTDILSKSATDPGSDPGGGGGEGPGGPPCHYHWSCSWCHWIRYRSGCWYSGGTSHTGLCHRGNSLSHRWCWHQQG